MSEDNKNKVKIHFLSDPEDLTLSYAPIEKTGKAIANYTTLIDGKTDLYEGDFKNGMRDGNGKYTFSNPDAKNANYSGSFAGHDSDSYHGGLPNGEGSFVYPDNSNYIGSFLNGQRHGQGVYTYPNGDVYCGGFASNKKHGNGIYTVASNSSQVYN